MQAGVCTVDAGSFFREKGDSAGGFNKLSWTWHSCLLHPSSTTGSIKQVLRGWRPHKDGPRSQRFFCAAAISSSVLPSLASSSLSF
jgi:hypothetical protein